MPSKVAPKWGLRFRHTTTVFLAVVGTLLYLLSAVIGLNWLVLGPLAALALLLSVVTYRHRTVFGWIGMRRRFRKSVRKDGALISAEGTGIVWDGNTASVFLELKQRPHTVTVINPDGSLTSPEIPIDVIRDELVQFDIHTESVTVITVGSQYVSPSTVSSIYHSLTGPVPALLNGRTLIRVSIALDASLDSVEARSGAKKRVHVGLSNTVTIAAARIRRRLEREGWWVETLTRKQVSDFTKDIKYVVDEPLGNETWKECSSSSLSVSALTPTRASWNQDRYQEWHQFSFHRMMTSLRLTRKSTQADHAEMYLTYASLQPDALDLAEAVGLWREYGQQGDIITNVIPTAFPVRPDSVPGRTLRRGEQFPIQMHPGGVGTFLGYGRNRSRVFVDFSAGDTEPFYVIAPDVFLQQLLVRLLTSGRTIDIRIPDDGSEIWPRFAEKMRAPDQMGYFSIPQADIVVAPESSLPRQEYLGQVVLAWTTTSPAVTPAYAIAVPGETAVVAVHGEQTAFQWTIASGERRLLTATVPGQESVPADDQQGRSARTRRRVLSRASEGRHVSR